MAALDLGSVLLGTLACVICLYLTYRPWHNQTMRRIPGPRSYAWTKWRLAYEDWRGRRTATIDQLHKLYGPVVRIGPNEVHFNSLSALRTIYGPGSDFGRTDFYRMFDVYNRQNLFTFHSSKQHGDRKRLIANAYSKTLMLKSPSASMVKDKVGRYLGLLARNKNKPQEIFSTLHYFSLDTITLFLYGRNYGGTSALQGNATHRALLNDILDPARRKLSWFAVHLPSVTKWLYTRTSRLERLLSPLLPMQKPATYTGIRAHALNAFYMFKEAALAGSGQAFEEPTIISQLWKHHESQIDGGLQDLELASECADHLLAGIDTTADTLMFLIWAISLPENRNVQERLVAEVKAISGDEMQSGDVPTVASTDRLVYLDAVIKETLRLYAPLPASEPRCSPTRTTIDGFDIPAGTTVSMSPFSLHRNADVFENPLKFMPERWLGNREELREMNRWFWAFSSGARMCIGLHLAMAEMTTLVAAVYRKYTTSISKGFEGKTPAITSRFELFYDQTMPGIEEHVCMINFEDQA